MQTPKMKIVESLTALQLIGALSFFCRGLFLIAQSGQGLQSWLIQPGSRQSLFCTPICLQTLVAALGCAFRLCASGEPVLIPH